MVDVLETIRGVSPAEHLRIDFRDLNLQLRGQEVIGFTTGEEYVLFLWTGPSGQTQIIGYTQGVFELPKRTGEAMAIRAATSETMLERSTGRVIRDEPLELTLQSLSRRITATVARQGAAK